MSIKKIKTLEESKSAFRSAYSQAMRDGSEQNMIDCLEQYSEDVCNAMLQEANSLSLEQRNNTEVLAARGVRQLTSAETAYYKALEKAMRTDASGVKNALTNIDVAMPETIIDQVMEDVKSSFSLLNAIDFVNSSYMTSWIYNQAGHPDRDLGCNRQRHHRGTEWRIWKDQHHHLQAVRVHGNFSGLP